MKLATRKNDTRDGELLIVSRDNTQAVLAGSLAPTMQDLLDNWSDRAPKLEAVYAALNAGEAEGAFAVDANTLHSPFPRASRGSMGARTSITCPRSDPWSGASSDLAHRPSGYQGGSDTFSAP